MEVNRDKIARLPVWAQDYIYGLERRLVEVNKQLALVSEGPDDSNVIIDDHVYPARPLGVGVPVKFVLDEGHIIVEHVKGDPGVLEVMAIGHGRKHALAIRPKSSNTVKLLLSEY